jgi:two-component system nitrogen regulation sensor histidine kinase NtrY
LNKWFKKFPYPGWLTILLVTVTLCVLAYHSEKNQYTPQALTATIQKDFSTKEHEVWRDHQSGVIQHAGKVMAGKESCFYSLFTVQRGNTICWSTVSLDLPDSISADPTQYLTGKMVQLVNGYYYITAFPFTDTPDKYNFTLIPIAYEYPIDNQYFRSSFVASDRVPVSTLITTEYEDDAYTIYDTHHKPVFYLVYTQSADQLYQAGLVVWLLTLTALCCLAFWIHELCYGIGLKTKKSFIGWLVLVVFLFLFSLLRRKYSFPAGFLNSKIFSPELFSSEGIKSFGSFLLTVLSHVWCLFYFIVNVPLEGVKIFKRKWADIAARVLICAVLNFYIFYELTNLIQKLIIDSKISFEAGNFSGLNKYTFYGIFSLCVISINFLLALGITNAALSGFIKRDKLRYLAFILLSCLTLVLLTNHPFKTFDLVILLMSVAGLLMIDSFGLPLQKPRKQNDLSVATAAYIWFAILCSWITLEIFYFNYNKEKDLRKIYAEKLERQDNGLVDYNFLDIGDNILKDSTVAVFLKSGTPEMRSGLNKYIFYNYLSDYAGKFLTNIYYYDRFRNPLFHADNGDRLLIHLADSSNGAPFVPGLTNVMNMRESNHMYWFLTPVLQKGDTLGYVGIDLAVNKSPQLAKRSFLEKKNNPTDQQYYDNYSYAIYRNKRLWKQEGDEIFPYVNNDMKPTHDVAYPNEDLERSTLVLVISPNEIIKVVYKRNLITNVVSIFSYVLGVWLGMAALIFLIRQLLFYPGKFRYLWKNFNFTIRSKVNLTILVTVFASLLIVGIVTLSFLNNRYKETQRKSLQSLLLYYTQSILRYAEEQRYNFDDTSPGFFSAYSDLSYKLNALAEEKGDDINLFNKEGKLIATSQLLLFRNGLISKHMQREVFKSLSKGDQSELMIKDKIGDLEYQSVYTPVRDKDDRILAYVNLPYYASGAERNTEISNVLVALINVYTLVFFLSGICAILISNSIIRSFRLLIDQFRNIRLRHNEYIEWPYKDEIGVLVKEYNAMMRKVEAMAARLARTEREEAWREIAKQVAHEIKNPLTPMKLNIQYLQQAILNGRPDIDKLASRVSVTLIEQIENLNLIATEFSSFAKMPEANPELLNLSQSLQSLVTLFQDNKTKVLLDTHKPDILIFMDKSHFIRVFTNLIQNAIQAIGDEREGLVTVTYEQTDDNVVISIKDNGSGIPKDMQEKLFLPYFTTKSSGTGLGLSMTKNMVEHSQGSIWFVTTEGEGSEFFVQLPVHQKGSGDYV